MRSTLKQFTCVIDYNGDFDSDSNNNVEFVNIDLLCNKLSVQLLANNSITHTKKRYVFEMEDKADELLKAKVTQEKKTPVNRVEKQSSKALVPVFDLIGKRPPDIQALFINTSIIISALYLF